MCAKKLSYEETLKDVCETIEQKQVQLVVLKQYKDVVVVSKSYLHRLKAFAVAEAVIALAIQNTRGR